MRLYRVLGAIAYEKGRDENGHPIVAKALKDAVVSLNEKDAAALTARGDVVFHAELEEVRPPALPPHEP